MDVIPDMRYMGPEERKRLFRLGGMIGLLLIIGIVVLLTRCHGSKPIDSVTRMQGDDQKALTQIREAMFEVGTALTGDSPASSVLEAVRKVHEAKGEALTKSVVDGSFLKFNPNKAHWAAGRGGGGVATVLVVGTAPPSYKARQVSLIGMAMGGIPVEISAGQEPDWLPKAVTP